MTAQQSMDTGSPTLARNAIGLTDPPEEMYGRTMSIPDGLIVKYFRLAVGASMVPSFAETYKPMLGARDRQAQARRSGNLSVSAG